MIRNPTLSWDCGSIFVFGGINMFEKGRQRFLTPGIKEGVPLEVQLLLWHLIDASDWQKRLPTDFRVLQRQSRQ